MFYYVISTYILFILTKSNLKGVNAEKRCVNAQRIQNIQNGFNYYVMSYVTYLIN